MSTRDDDSIRESFNKYDTEGGSLRPSSTRQASSIQYGTDDGKKEADPKAVIQKFRKVDAGRSDHFDTELPELPLPGSGGRTDSCGDDFQIPRACADCGNVTHVGRTCYRSRCPRCWKGWDRRRSTTVTSKMEALRRYRESKTDGWDGWKFHHLVLSPPDGYKLNSDDPLQRTFDLLKEVLGEIGVDTGYLFYHPFRGPDNDDRGFWKSVLPEGEYTGRAAMKEENDLQHSPHFHAVVLSQYVDTEHVVGAVEEATGWTIHRITKGEDSDVSLYNDYDLARSVTYCMSHTGIGEDRVAYRPFGEVANFTANENIERLMDARVRSVGVNTLGLDYSSEACVVKRDMTKTRTIETWEEKVNLGAAHGDGAGEPEMVKVEEEVEEEVHEECNGRLLEVTAFPRLLNDEEFMAKAEHAQDLARTWEIWRDRVDDDRVPDPDPWDEPSD